MGYGMAKAAVHQLTKGLAQDNSGLPPDSSALTILPWVPCCLCHFLVMFGLPSSVFLAVPPLLFLLPWLHLSLPLFVVYFMLLPFLFYIFPPTAPSLPSYLLPLLALLFPLLWLSSPPVHSLSHPLLLPFLFYSLACLCSTAPSSPSFLSPPLLLPLLLHFHPLPLSSFLVPPFLSLFFCTLFPLMWPLYSSPCSPCSCFSSPLPVLLALVLSTPFPFPSYSIFIHCPGLPLVSLSFHFPLALVLPTVFPPLLLSSTCAHCHTVSPLVHCFAIRLPEWLWIHQQTGKTCQMLTSRLGPHWAMLLSKQSLWSV